MTTRVLISFFCDDRPGVIEQLSALINQHGGNWLDSQLSRLGGRFAGVLQAQLPEDQQEALGDALSRLEADGIICSLTDAGAAPQESLATQRLTLLGPDRPGIVRELTRALRMAGFNIRSMETSVETAPMSGEPLFRAEACIELHSDSRLDELEWQLDAMADSMTLEIDLIPD
ncbi:glycine cleavage system protein R [Congregibacter litoralis]|uniref:Glycine cleavage system transcriptional repressor n=1 Tax=Congregibacter litoralis KT71 TaxID=314285 RepID=A4A3J5_9GAMM|nr:ACT domain-containing protein [Congregibacter litoralis]EAQ99268.2 ACT domain protein [Congregibacter litoralis KT71]